MPRRKGFQRSYWFSGETIGKLMDIQDKRKFPSQVLTLETIIAEAYEREAIKKPSEISLEEAKEVIACQHYEAYPKDSNFMKCHQFQKPRIRSKKDCEICKSMKTLYDNISKDLNILTKKKSELEGHIRANQDSLRTVTSEYHRIQKRARDP